MLRGPDGTEIPVRRDELFGITPMLVDQTFDIVSLKGVFKLNTTAGLRLRFELGLSRRQRERIQQTASDFGDVYRLKAHFRNHSEPELETQG